MEPSTWQRPGLRAALLYAVAAGLLGVVVSTVSRLELTAGAPRPATRARPSRRADDDLAGLGGGVDSDNRPGPRQSRARMLADPYPYRMTVHRFGSPPGGPAEPGHRAQIGVHAVG